MPERIPQSVTIRVPLKVYLSSDHISDATGKTVAVTISKNGAAFGNPSAGATNATEIANGWYYVDLSTTDTGTTGPLIVRGTSASCDNSEAAYNVVNANNAGFAALPNAAAEAAGGLYTRGSGAGQISQPSNGLIDVNAKQWNGLTTVALPLVPTTAGRTLDVSATGEAGVDWANVGGQGTTVNLSATTISAVSGAVGSVTGNVGGNVAGSVGSVTANVNAVLINGAHGGPSMTLTFERMRGISTTLNEPCIHIDGNGTGAGMEIHGGANGPGLFCWTPATSKFGIYAKGPGGGMWTEATGTDGVGWYSSAIETGCTYGFYATGLLNGVFALGGGTDGSGILIRASGAGVGVDIQAGLTGRGMSIMGGSTSGHGMTIYSNSGHGLDLSGAGVSGDDIHLFNSDAPTLRDAILTASSITSTVIANDAITDAKIAVPAETTGRPTRILAMLRRIWEWRANKRIRTRATGVVQLRNAADSGNLVTETQSTAGGAGAEVDTQTAES